MTKPTVDRERYLKTFTHDIDWPSGTLEDLVEFMNNLKVKYPSDVELKIYHEWAGYEDCYYYVDGGTYESDTEYAERVAEEISELSSWEHRQEERRIRKEKQELEEKLKKQAEQLEAYKVLQKDLKSQGLL